MTLGVAVKRGDAHQSVDAVFAFQISERKIAFKLKGDGFDSGNVAFLEVELADFVTLLFAPHQVHAHQHRGPVATLGSAGSGCNLQHGAHAIAFVRKHVAEFHVFNQVQYLIVLVVEFFFGEFAFTEKFVGDLQFIGQIDGFFVIFDPFLFASQIADDYLGFARIVPEIRGKGFFFFVGDFNQFGIDVKDTSSALQGALQYL